MEAGASQPVISREPPPPDPPPLRDVERSGSLGGRIAIAVVLLLVLGGAGLWVARSAGREDAPAATKAASGAPVAVAAVTSGEMTARRRYPGELFSDAVELGSRVSGHVLSIDVRIGDEVEAGQVLARIDDAVIERRITATRAQIPAQRSQLKASEVARKAAERDLARVTGLVDKGVISQQEVDELRTAYDQRDAAHEVARSQLQEAQARLSILREDLKDTSVTAPFAGVIARRDVDPGAFVEPGAPLVRLVARSPLRVRFRLPEHELTEVREGLRFAVHARGAGDRVPQGEVTRISGEVTREDRTLLVEGLVDAHEGLRPGMYVDIELEMRRLTDALIVPDAAVVERVEADGSSRVGVFVLDDGAARWQDVHVIAREHDRVAVEAVADTRGLHASDRVFVRGHRELQDGAAVRVVDEEGAPARDP